MVYANPGGGMVPVFEQSENSAAETHKSATTGLLNGEPFPIFAAHQEFVCIQALDDLSRKPSHVFRECCGEDLKPNLVAHVGKRVKRPLREYCFSFAPRIAAVDMDQEHPSWRNARFPFLGAASRAGYRIDDFLCALLFAV
jgi:hypothetical protein